MSPMFLFISLVLAANEFKATEGLRCWTCVETEYHEHGGPPIVSHGLCGEGSHMNHTENTEACPSANLVCYSKAVIKNLGPGKSWTPETMQKSCKKAFWGGQNRKVGCETVTQNNLVFEHCLCDTDDCNKKIHEFEKTT